MDGAVPYIGSYAECVKASRGKLTAHSADDEMDYRESNAKMLKRVTVDDDTDDDEEEETDEEETVASDGQKEVSNIGAVTVSTYLNYVRAMGGLWVAVFLVVLFSVTQGSVLVTVAYMGKWAELEYEQQSDWEVLTLIGGLGVAVVLLALFRAIISFRLTIKASQVIHDRMAEAVLRAKIEFFDTNPLGRIMNRFSADVGSNGTWTCHDEPISSLTRLYW